MEVWPMVLYGGATFLAIRSLVVLMEHHKRYFRQELTRKELQRAEEFAAREAATPKHAPAEATRKAA